MQRLFRILGYEVARLDRFGKDPVADIGRLFNGRALEVIFDVGANEGQTSEQFAAAFPRAVVYSFEPFEPSFEKLSALAEGSVQVRPVRCALGDVEAEMKLHVNSASVTNSLLPNAPEAEEFQPAGMAREITSVTTRVSTVDAQCESAGVPFIDVLKTDTQGYDLHVLRGAERMIRGENVAVVLAEVLFAPLYSGQSYFHDIYAHLWARGFRLVTLYGVALNENGYASWCDALFVHPQAVLRRRRKRGVA